MIIKQIYENTPNRRNLGIYRMKEKRSNRVNTLTVIDYKD